MSKAAFGRTWWGAQWLQALTQIDFENRLPRGRTYANRGAVRGLVVTGGAIKAKVQGSRPKPYEVSIEVPAIKPADVGRLIERLAVDPALIARLLNRELDPALLQEAHALGITVFPGRWNDLKMQCSCPDWAVPCKHLAAVIYLLSQEIDGNPFLVFSLRGVDLIAQLRQRGIEIAADANPALPSREQALFGATAHPAPETAPQANAAGDLGALEALDLTTIPDLGEPLWRVLSASPVFFRNGDFREAARRVMARVAKHARQLLAATGSGDDCTCVLTGDLQLSIDDKGALIVAGIELAGQPLESLPMLMQVLASVAPARLADLPAPIAALHSMRLLALHLLAQGAVVPQVFVIDARSVGLRWCAAELDATVRALLERVAQALPAELLQRRNGRKREPLAGAVQARVLMCELLDYFLLSANAAAAEKPAGDKVLALFFGSARAAFDGPGEGAVAGSIQSWLARLHLARHAHTPVLELDEDVRGEDFALSLAVAEEAAPLQAPTALAEVMAAPAWASRRYAVLQTVAMLAEFHLPLAGYVRAGARTPLAVATAELPALLFEALPALRLIGIRALLPKVLQRLLRPRLSMQLKAASASVPSFLKSEDLFAFDWRISLGEEQLTAEEFERLLGQASGIVRFRGEYVYLDPAEIEKLRARLTRPPPVGGSELLRAALAGEYDGAPVRLDAAAQRILDELKREDAVALPDGLLATLRPYQQRGYAWLWRNARMGLGSVIADDMGLGKTLQVIALLLRLKQDGALAAGGALVVVPTSLLTNWQKEAARFAPELAVAVFHGAKRELTKERPDVLLTTYGVVRSEVAQLKKLVWRIVVIDEAQNIKNAAAAQAKAIKAIGAGSHVAMSGTPVENRLSEYWSIMDFAQRGYLGGPTHFAREYATPIQTHRDAAAAERLRKVMAPFVLRRLKSDKSIISDLPDKLTQDQYCTLTQSQAALYESVVREGLASIAGESNTFQRQGLVLQMILALKQVCNHPAQYLKQGAADAGQSGKAERLLDLLDEIHAAQEKVLIFTQFREMGELLARMLRERDGREPLFLHGGVARGKRDQMVERFQNERSERVFLLSLKAGGTGLNLTAASHVVHFDLWWNPAVEAQATDRAYRIGQQRNVQVHRFITRGTFEERINDMILSKRKLAEMTVGTGETWVGQLPPQELRGLFELRSASA